MKSLATQEYWDSHWQEAVFEIAPKNHPIRQWIEQEIPNTATGRCMEVGCYPGKFLAVFGEKGYELNGIDSFPGVHSLGNWCARQGYKRGNFYKEDFLTFVLTEQYDLVCSFGFIEHFENWPEVLEKHLALVKPGGKIVIDVPNLNSFVYYTLYQSLESHVLGNHVLHAMDLGAIRDVLVTHGCTIEYAGYVGKFYFRFVTKHGRRYRLMEHAINFFAPVLMLFPQSAYKRYIGIIATKAQD